MGLLNKILTERYNQPKTLPELLSMTEGEDVGARVKCSIETIQIKSCYEPHFNAGVSVGLDAFFYDRKDKDKSHEIHGMFGTELPYQDFYRMVSALKPTKKAKDCVAVGTYNPETKFFNVEMLRIGDYAIFSDRLEYRKK